MEDRHGATTERALGPGAPGAAGNGAAGLGVEDRSLARLIPEYRKLCGEVAALEAAQKLMLARGYFDVPIAIKALDGQRKLLGDVLGDTPRGGSRADGPMLVPPDEHPERREEADAAAVEDARMKLINEIIGRIRYYAGKEAVPLWARKGLRSILADLKDAVRRA